MEKNAQLRPTAAQMQEHAFYVRAKSAVGLSVELMGFLKLHKAKINGIDHEQDYSWEYSFPKLMCVCVCVCVCMWFVYLCGCVRVCVCRARLLLRRSFQTVHVCVYLCVREGENVCMCVRATSALVFSRACCDLTLQHTATHCDTLQTHCNTLQQTATHCKTLQNTATHCNALQHTATHCYTLQHTALHCNTLRGERDGD